MRSGTLHRFRDIIVSIEYIHHEAHKGMELFKSKIILIDGSNLRILEKYEGEKLEYYSCYRLTSSNKLIIGWDSAPHHIKLSTFPHHKHLAGKQRPIASHERNLAEVMRFIATRLQA